MSVTISCKLCPSVIHDDDVLEAIRLSEEHMKKAHATPVVPTGNGGNA